jgi:HK97 family phage portal protein
MQIGNKVWSGAPGVVADELQPGVGLKDLQFIPADASLWGGQQGLLGYRHDVQEGLDSNVIMAPVAWIMRTFTEATARVQSRNPDSIWKWVEDHDVEVLIDKPNDHYDGDALWKATCISFVLAGNGYWLKVRNGFGEVLGFWYLPHWLVSPRWPEGRRDIFIEHYEYQPIGGGAPLRIPVRDIVHFRFGLDPRNPRLGLSPLHSLYREIFTDDEAQNFSAKILQNMGVPGLMVSPATDKFNPSQAEVEALKAYLKTAFSGANRGAPMVMQIPTTVTQFGFDPNKLMLANLRDISEERVCAMLGLPAAVVGFGSGLQSTKVGATMRELRRLAWVQCLTPMQKSMAKQLTAQLLPDFQSQTRRFRVRFDVSDVAAYQEDDDALATRVATLVQAGILRVDKAQEMMGLEVDETQKVYLRPSNSLPIDENGEPIERATSNGAVDGGNNGGIPAAVAGRLATQRNGRNGSTPDTED